jgi:hypothetical protein
MGIPKILYTDSDQTFRGEVETLLASFNVTHMTSYPYMQRGNSVESQVRKFLNATRAAIADSAIAKHEEWHILYPLIIIRLNTLISKYGLSREYVHFQHTLDTHLPLILDINLDDGWQDNLNQTSHRFRGAIQKFLKNKREKKSQYPDKKTYDFTLHELVMRKDYTPSSTLKHTFLGPYRIIELYEQGALLKDPRTGDQMSVHFANLRKITMTEFAQLLPTHFDADLLKTLHLFRYNKIGNPEKITQHSEQQLLKQEESNNTADSENERPNPEHRENIPTPDTQEFSPASARILRSGRKINISTNTLPTAYTNAISASWSTLPTTLQPPLVPTKKRRSILSSIALPRTPYYQKEQIFQNDQFIFSTSIENRINFITPEKNFKTRYKSSFQSDRKGILYINLPEEPTKASRVRFSRLEIKFY